MIEWTSDHTLWCLVGLVAALIVHTQVLWWRCEAWRARALERGS